MTQPDPRIYATSDKLQTLQRYGSKISFSARQPAKSLLNGRHASKIKGRGLSFEELRHYVAGDDIRTIDWKVTARTRTPHVRVYSEEKDRAVLMVVDQRMSMFFGSRLNMKSVTAAETAAIAGFAALENGDRVGGVIFGEKDCHRLRPRAGRHSFDVFLEKLATANAALDATSDPTDTPGVDTALEAALRLVTPGALVLMISDFDGWSPRTETLLKGLRQRAEVILFSVTDPISQDLPRGAQITVSDGSLQLALNTSDVNEHGRLQEYTSGRLNHVIDFARRSQIPLAPLSSGQPTADQVLRLFGLRGRAK